jgi:hypothetical protein
MDTGGEPAVTIRNQYIRKALELSGDPVRQVNQIDSESADSAHGDRASPMRGRNENETRDVIPWFKEYGAPRQTVSRQPCDSRHSLLCFASRDSRHLGSTRMPPMLSPIKTKGFRRR